MRRSLGWLPPVLTLLVAAGVLALAATIAWGRAAQAQAVRCAPTQQIETDLLAKFGESRLGVGSINERVAMALLINEATRSWTLLAVGADGITCIIAVGKNFDFVMPPPKQDKES